MASLFIILLVLVFLARLFLSMSREVPRHILSWTILLALVGLILRFFLIPVSFSHSNFFAPALLDSLLGLDNVGVNSYGPVGFWFYRPIALLEKDPLTSIAFVNNIVWALSGLALGMALVLVTGEFFVLPATLAVAMVHPACARFSLTEDIIVLALFLSFYSSFELVQTIRRHSAAANVMHVLSSIMVFWTRQTVFPWMVATHFSSLVLGIRRREKRIWAPSLLLLAVLSFRVFQDVHTHDVVSYHLLLEFLTDLDWVAAAARSHPLLDSGTLLLFLPAFAIGCAGLFRKNDGVFILFPWASSFLFTSIATMDNIGDGIGFRSSALLGGLAIWATGLSLFVERVLRGHRRLDWIGIVVSVIVPSIFGLCSRQWYMEVTPETREYRYISQVMPILNQDQSIATVRGWNLSPALELPKHVVSKSNPGIIHWGNICQATGKRNTVVYLGLFCNARSFPEIWYWNTTGRGNETYPWDSLEVEDPLVVPPRADMLRWSLHGELPIDLEIPRWERRICQDIRRLGRPLTPALEIFGMKDDPPFAVWVPEPARLEFVEVGPVALEQIRRLHCHSSLEVLSSDSGPSSENLDSKGSRSPGRDPGEAQPMKDGI